MVSHKLVQSLPLTPLPPLATDASPLPPPQLLKPQLLHTHACHLSWWLWPMQAHSLHQPHSHSTPTLQRLHCWAAIAHGKAQIELKFELLGSHIIRCRYWAAMSLPAAAGRPHHPLPIHWAAILGGHIIRCRCWSAMSLPAAGRPPRVTVSAQQGQVWGLMRSCCWA